MVGHENKVNNYYSVMFGKVVRSLGQNKPENMDHVKERENKNGNIVYEQFYDYIEGRIVGANLQHHEQYGDSIKLKIENDGLSAELSIAFNSAYGRSFLFKLPNLDISKDVYIKPLIFTSKEGKEITTLMLFQNYKIINKKLEGDKIENAYTKDNPNGLPQLKKVKFNGKEQWDKTDQLAFLKEKFNDFILQFDKQIAQVEPESFEDLVTSEEELDF